VIAFVIGQIVHTVAMAGKLQNGKDISFSKAFEIYVNSESRNYAVAFCLLICLLFVMSEFVHLEADIDALRIKQAKSIYDYVLIYYKTISLFIGIFASHIFYLIYGKGKKAIDNYINKMSDNL
jgi:hypothetical protein